MANVERLMKLRAAVAANPERHYQKFWASRPVDQETGELLVEGVCGTTCCMAGTASLLAGEKIDWENGTDVMRDDDRMVRVAGMLKSGEYIENFAAEWLGLDGYQASDLFMTMNEREALEMLDDLIEANQG